MRDRVPRARAREREVARGSRAGRVRGAAAGRSRTSISVHVDFSNALLTYIKNRIKLDQQVSYLAIERISKHKECKRDFVLRSLFGTCNAFWCDDQPSIAALGNVTHHHGPPHYDTRSYMRDHHC